MERGSDKTSTQVRGADLGEDPVDLCFTSLSKKKKPERERSNTAVDVRCLTLEVTDPFGLAVIYARRFRSFAGAP